MVGAIVVTGYSTEKEVPEFGLVTKVVTLPTISYFQLKKYVAAQFNNHFHAYEVIAGEEPPTLVTSNQFFIHTPMHLVRPIIDQAVLALGTTLRRRNRDYVFWIAICIVVTKIDGKRDACNDLG